MLDYSQFSSMFYGSNSTPNLIANVVSASNSSVSAISDNSLVDIPIVSIPGIHYLPPDKADILAVPSNGQYFCCGSVLSCDSSIAQGELIIKSSGGALIKLLNDGSISLNGLIIDKSGNIVK